MVVIWLACAFGCFTIAEKKGRDKYHWAVYGIIGGIFTIILLLILPCKNNSNGYNSSNLGRRTKNYSSVNMFRFGFGIIICVFGVAASITGVGAVIGVPAIAKGLTYMGKNLLKKSEF